MDDDGFMSSGGLAGVARLARRTRHVFSNRLVELWHYGNFINASEKATPAGARSVTTHPHRRGLHDRSRVANIEDAYGEVQWGVARSGLVPDLARARGTAPLRRRSAASELV